MSDLQELTDRTDLNDLLARQGRWLDERRFEESGSIFTDDVSVSTPGGQADGLPAVIDQARRTHTRYARTQHVTSNVIIDLSGDHATVGANLIATLVQDDSTGEPTLTLGERYHFEAVRTPQGWRFRRVEITPIWRVGTA